MRLRLGLVLPLAWAQAYTVDVSKQSPPFPSTRLIGPRPSAESVAVHVQAGDIRGAR